jgi:hypothetical protein
MKPNCSNCKLGYNYKHVGPPHGRHAHTFCYRDMEEHHPDDYCLSWQRKEEDSEATNSGNQRSVTI